MDDVYQAPDACYSILASHQHSGILNKLSKVDSWNTLTERLKHLLEWAARVTNTKSDSAISQTELLKFSDSLDIFRSQLDAFVRSSWRQDSAPVDVLLVCDRLGKLTLDLCQSVPLSKVQAFAQTDSPTGSTPLLTELLDSIHSILHDLLNQFILLDQTTERPTIGASSPDAINGPSSSAKTPPNLRSCSPVVLGKV
ncbi:hypothetical protein AHF37_09573 [Paragonimus kellicotti]|nr:hypothetical protein AHF37_09573 [Paragonimus kellicotti]